MIRKSIVFLILSIVLSVSLLASSSNKIQANEITGKTSENFVHKENNNKVGLLLILSQLGGNLDDENYYAPRTRTEEYRTVWITADGYAIDFIEKKGVGIVSGSDGFYKIEQIHGKKNNENEWIYEVNKTISYKVGREHKSQVAVKDYAYLVYSSEGFHLDFVGSEYLSILRMRVYTSGAGGYQYTPSIKFCKLGYSLAAAMEVADEESGAVSIKEIIPHEFHASIDSQIQAYKDKFNKTVKVESDHDTQYISESDMTLHRAVGRWKLVVPLKFSNWKYSHNHFVSFHEIDCPLPKALVGHDELCIPFDEIKKTIPDAKDAVSSPDNRMLVVQTADSLKIFINPLKGIANPVFIVPIESSERIILNQWSLGQALEKWDEELSKLLN